MLYNDDCRNILSGLKSNDYDLIILDPPYGRCTNAEWDSNTFNLKEILPELFRLLKPTGSLYLHCGMGEKSNSLITWFNDFKSSNFHFKETITWKKTRGIGMRKGWLQTSEFILWYVKDNKQFKWNIKNQYSQEKRPFNIVRTGGEMVNKSEFKRFTTVWDIPEIGFGSSPAGFRKIKSQIAHCTPKHPRLSERMITLHCNSDSKILIPFAGSGMELLSCNYKNIKFDAIEIDKENCNFIQNNNLKYEDFI